MSGGYNNEFEKWLQCSKKDDDSAEDTDDNDGLLIDEDDSSNDKEDWYEHSWKKENAKSSHDSAPILEDSDSAPILVDSDDEIFPHQKNQFEDEPPILEPAPKHTGEPMARPLEKGSNKNNNHNDFLKNYSRHKLTKSSSLSEKKGSLKTYSSRKKLESNDDHPKLSKESGNIFDKFTTLSEPDYDDAPPPLIPSPEAMHLHGDSPTTEQSQSQSSPAFVAMEADSTSELPGNGPRSRGLSKNWATGGNDGLECDSTCMFGGSPLIVSPAASNSEGEQRDQGGGDGGTDLDQNIKEENSLSPSQNHQSANLSVKRRESSDDKTCSKSQTTNVPSPPSSKQEPLPTLEHCSIEKDHPDHKSISLLKSRPLPTLEMCPDKDGINTANSKESYSPNLGDLDEPPVLCIIPVNPSPNRAKRHTIDSPDTFSPSGKRPRTIPSPTNYVNEDTNAQPPRLPHVSELEQTKHDHHAHSPKHRKSTRPQRKRCQSSCLPSTSSSTITAQVQHLPNCLQTFTLASCALSNLQDRMHKLLYTLFPALRAELQTMAPGSVRFEALLSDLVHSLQRDEGPAESQSSQRPNSVFPPDSKELVLPSQQLSDNPTHAANSNFDNHAITSLETDQSSTFSVRKLFSGQHNEQKPEDRTPSVGENEIIPGLSCLHLSNDSSKTYETNPQKHQLQPISIPLQQDVEEQLWDYSQLSCAALQLLLPDLTVSLGNELQQNSANLQVFLENVISSNSKEKNK